MDPQTQTQKTIGKKGPLMKILLISLVLLFVVLLYVLYTSQNLKKDEESKNVSTSQSPTSEQKAPSTEGTFTLKTSSETATINTPVEVVLEADSNGKSIVGYDLVLAYDPTSLEVNTASSLLPDFTVYPLQSADHYTVTATKKITSEEPSIFDGGEILKLTVTPKKAGMLKLSLVSMRDKEKTQMVDETTKVMYPAVSEITLEVK